MKQKHYRHATFFQSVGFILILFFLFIPPFVGAGTVPPGGTGCPAGCPAGQCNVGTPANPICVLENPAPGQLVNFPDFGSLLKLIVNIFLTFAGAIAVVFLIIGGYQYVAARGNEEATERAKKTVTGAILGIVIIVMAFAIVSIVNTLLTTTPPP